MSKVERFFHIRSGLMTGGATVRVVGDTEQVGQVDVQVAYCHTPGGILPDGKKFKGDTFSKKIGRAQAREAVTKIIPLRYLHAELGRIEHTVLKRARREWMGANDYNFATKYFLPKE